MLDTVHSDLLTRTGLSTAEAQRRLADSRQKPDAATFRFKTGAALRVYGPD